MIGESLTQLGPRLAIFGLALGAGCYVSTRPGSRQASGPYGRGRDRAARALAIPLLVIGVVGLVLWGIGSLRG